MRILITGGTGQIGSDLAKVLHGTHEILALGKEGLDITQSDIVTARLTDFAPNYVVNCAAFTKVDACEQQQELAWRANAEGPGILAKACGAKNIPLLHLSTDYVFDGARPPSQSYSEEELTGPISCYGKSKLEGERQVFANTDRAVILRTAWVYGAVGNNFLKAILRKALKGERFRVVDDQFGAPTWSYRIALQIRRLIEHGAKGLFHGTAEGATHWFEVAQAFFAAMAMDVDLVPCRTADYPTPARRPANSILENKRLKALGLNEMQPWREDLTEFVGQFKDRLLLEARAK
jgi:dTDP-4-dehydrorhamnose reductase